MRKQTCEHMKIEIVINVDDSFVNDYTDDLTHDVARLLKSAAGRIDGHPHFGPGHFQSIIHDDKEVGYISVHNEGE